MVISKTDEVTVEDLGDDIRKITLHNHPVNSLTADVIRQLTQAVRDAGSRKILLMAEGKEFCAGLDRIDIYKSIVHNRTCAPLVELLVELYRAILVHKEATACIVQEDAHGGGVGLASCFDRVWAWQGVKFVIPSGDYRPLALVLIPVLNTRASRFNLLAYDVEKWIGVTVDRQEAERRGLVTSTYYAPVDDVEAEAVAWLRKNVGTAPGANTLEMLDKGVESAMVEVRKREVSMAIGLGIVSDLLERLIDCLASEPKGGRR